MFVCGWQEAAAKGVRGNQGSLVALSLCRSDPALRHHRGPCRNGRLLGVARAVPAHRMLHREPVGQTKLTDDGKGLNTSVLLASRGQGLICETATRDRCAFVDFARSVRSKSSDSTAI
jgi:hypothetical protein